MHSHYPVMTITDAYLKLNLADSLSGEELAELQSAADEETGGSLEKLLFLRARDVVRRRREARAAAAHGKPELAA